MIAWKRHWWTWWTWWSMSWTNDNLNYNKLHWLMLLDAQSWNNGYWRHISKLQKWLGRSLSILSILRVPNSDPSIATKGFSKTMKRPPKHEFSCRNLITCSRSLGVRTLYLQLGSKVFVLQCLWTWGYKSCGKSNNHPRNHQKIGCITHPKWNVYGIGFTTLSRIQGFDQK